MHNISLSLARAAAVRFRSREPCLVRQPGSPSRPAGVRHRPRFPTSDRPGRELGHASGARASLPAANPLDWRRRPPHVWVWRPKRATRAYVSPLIIADLGREARRPGVYDTYARLGSSGFASAAGS